MTDQLGRGSYEVDVDTTRAAKGVGDVETKLKGIGTSATGASTQATGALGRIQGAVTNVGGRFDTMQKSGGLMGALAGGVGLGAGLGVFNAIGGAVSGAMEAAGHAIELSSDKAEAASKANVLFGDSYHIIEEASKGAATTVGLSSGAYLTAAGNLGNLITNFGITGDKAANMSTEMVALAADMGSFNNASTQEVTEAMGSAFRGEMEPIRRFGVMLDAASVSAKAVAMGLAEQGQPLTAAAKLQASYALILEQTGKAQGDFARTSDGLANSQRINAAKQEEAMTKLGDAIAPLAAMILPGLAAVLTSTVEAITGIISAFGTLGKDVDNFNRLLDPSRAEMSDWKVKIQEMGTAAGWSAEQIERAQAEIAAAHAGGARDFDKSAQSIIGSIDEEIAKTKYWADVDAREVHRVIANQAEVQKSFKGTSTVTSAAFADVQKAIVGHMRSASEKAAEIARNIPLLTAKGIESGKDEVQAAAADLKWAMEHPLAGIAQRNWLLGQLSSKQLAAGMKSTEPAVRAAAQAEYDLIQQKLASMPGYVWGSNLGNSFARGIGSAYAAVRDKARTIASAAGNQMEHRSPPKEGPLRAGGGAEVWGRKFGGMWAKGIGAAEGEVRAAVGRLAVAPTATMGIGFAMAGGSAGLSLAGASGTTSRVELGGTVRVQMDLANAPAGVTNAGVAAIVERSIDFGGVMRNLQQRRALPFEPAL